MDKDYKIDWRWSKLDPTFFGLHASVLLMLPILIVSTWIFGSTGHYNILVCCLSHFYRPPVVYSNRIHKILLLSFCN